MKSYLVIGLAFVMVLGLSAFAMAQDDTAVTDDTITTDDTATGDDTATDFAATVEFSNPAALEADTAYSFNFTVTNTTSHTMVRWIYDVEMFLPSSGYVLDQTTLTAPTSPRATDPLWGGTWAAEAMDDNGTAGIKWQFTGVVSSESYGDIRDGEAMDFTFNATTDGTATDGFDWRLIALDNATPTPNEYTLIGKAYIKTPIGDDTSDDTVTADDDLVGGDDSGSNGGCGC